MSEYYPVVYTPNGGEPTHGLMTSEEASILRTMILKPDATGTMVRNGSLWEITTPHAEYKLSTIPTKIGIA